jgi:L-ascorbate metabolism protein UlaG (beta-lactamase superfamily)
LILLSQGLEDHAHPPTLKQLDHTIPVVASPNAAKVVQGLDYQEIHTLENGEVFQLDQLEIIAVPGSPVGPTVIENGYILKDLKNNISLYYEPHGYHAAEIKKYAPVDIIITPLMNLTLPILGPIIKGQKNALKVCQWLNPKVILPTAAGGDVHFEGFLLKFLKTEGSIVEFQNLLQHQGSSTQVINPKPGQITPILLPI